MAITWPGRTGFVCVPTPAGPDRSGCPLHRSGLFGLTRGARGDNRARQQCRRVLQIEHTRDCRRREIRICREKHGANAAVWKVEVSRRTRSRVARRAAAVTLDSITIMGCARVCRAEGGSGAAGRFAMDDEVRASGLDPARRRGPRVRPPWGRRGPGRQGARGSPTAPERNGATYAALDLGTNNCRLLVARPTADGFRVIY